MTACQHCGYPLVVAPLAAVPARSWWAPDDGTWTCLVRAVQDRDELFPFHVPA